MKTQNIVQQSLAESNYYLSLFKKSDIEALKKKVVTKTVKNKKVSFVKCIVRDKEVQLKARGNSKTTLCKSTY